MKNKLVPVLLLLLCFSLLDGQQAFKTLLFTGTYTGGEPADGIYVYEFDSHSGKVKKLGNGHQLTNPSFLTGSPNGQYLYACTDTKTPNAGSITAFKIDSLNGNLALLNKQPSGGENPVYVTVNNTNGFIVNANYTQATASVFKVSNDGSLQPVLQTVPFIGSSVLKNRQDKAHLHAAVFSPKNDYVFFTDLGADKIHVFHFDTSDVKPLTERNDLAITTIAGSGPRHFTFHPFKSFAYCLEELSGTVSVYSYQDGKLDPVQRVFLYASKQGDYESADIHFSPDGLFFYASNRGNDNSISIFSVDPIMGTLKLSGHTFTYGRHPRNFTISPDGKFLLVANTGTNNIVIFKRNEKTGALKKIKTEISVPGPSCLYMRTYNLNATLQHD